MADGLLARADQLKTEIVCGTREQWQAWEMLDTAARYVYNAVYYLLAHEELAKQWAERPIGK